MLKGGATTTYVYKAEWNNEEHYIKGLDYTSLYPSMMLLNLPLGDY